VHTLAAASKYPALVLVLAHCGVRWGETTGLRVKHLDILKRRLMIEEDAVQVGSVIELGAPKNHKKRTVPFPRFLGERLARQCEGKGREDLVFPGENGHLLRLARVHEDNMSWFV
jgi:integrase